MEKAQVPFSFETTYSQNQGELQGDLYYFQVSIYIPSTIEISLIRGQ